MSEPSCTWPLTQGNQFNIMSEEVQKKAGNNAASEFLSDITGNKVIVKVIPGIEYHGILDAVDGFMNITLQETKEVYDKQIVADYGKVFIRGSIVSYIAAA